MKVALVIQHADPARGGAEKYTLDIARALSHRGHDVAILASSFGDMPWEARETKIVLCGGIRTPFGHFAKSLAHVSPEHLLTLTINGLLAKTTLYPHAVDGVMAYPYRAIVSRVSSTPATKLW